MLGGLNLRDGEEIVTATRSIPACSRRWGGLAVRHGVKVRVVPFAELVGAVSRRPG